MALSGGDPWAYSPPLSLWKLVQQNVSEEEQEEIRSMLGTSLIETTLDLHNEVDMLLEIWREYQTEMEAEIHNTCPLAEPPHVRERLIQEICFLAEGIREKSERKGMNPSALFSRHNSEILEYAEEAQRSGSSLGTSRPMSARASDGRVTPLSPSEQANSRADLSDNISENVSSASGKLNYLQFDQVCSRLRETLAKEIEQLEVDVVFLQDCLDSAADTRSRAGTPALSREPTLTELREERSLLEKELLSAENLPKTPPVSKPAFLAKSPASSITKMQNLTPVNARLRPAQQTGIDKGASSKTAPLKASHLINSTSPTNMAPSNSDSSVSLSQGPVSLTGHNSRVISQAYDLNADSSTMSQPRQSDQRGQGYVQGDDSIRRRDGSGGRCHRMRSPARVKIVPVGSIVDPRVDSAGSPPFIPAPPPAVEKPHLPRPNSADRFRKMVMQHRETT